MPLKYCPAGSLSLKQITFNKCCFATMRQVPDIMGLEKESVGMFSDLQTDWLINISTDPLFFN